MITVAAKLTSGLELGATFGVARPSLVGLLASPDVEGEGSIFNVEGHLLILLSSLGYKNPRILI